MSGVSRFLLQLVVVGITALTFLAAFGYLVWIAVTLILDTIPKGWF